MTTKPAKPTTPALVNLWVCTAGYWVLEHQAVPVVLAHAFYRAKERRGTRAQDMRIMDAGV